MSLVERGDLCIGFHLGEHIGHVRSLMRKYNDTPMSLADACFVRMAELNMGHAVLTLDSGFSVYRRFGRDALPLITPGAC